MPQRVIDPKEFILRYLKDNNYYPNPEPGKQTDEDLHNGIICGAAALLNEIQEKFPNGDFCWSSPQKHHSTLMVVADAAKEIASELSCAIESATPIDKLIHDKQSELLETEARIGAKLTDIL